MPSYIFDDPAHPRLQFAEVRAASLQLIDALVGGFAAKNPHHTTTLFSGYSTIPCACAAFNRGITCQASDSSITVFTATHSPSLRVDMVGFLSAGKTASTPSKSSLRTLSIRPTRS